MNVELQRRGLRRDIALDLTIGLVISLTRCINSIFKNIKVKAIKRVYNKPFRRLYLKIIIVTIITI